MLKMSSGIQSVEDIRGRPGLIAEHDGRVDGRRDGGSTEELITGFGALHFVLVFEVGGELRSRSELPPAIGCAHAPPAVRVFDVGMDVFSGRRD